ncbi:MAG TPA: glycosyltransferase family 4 protein [Solirubrobacterales bacterium]|nr:glycosyltransferase family 4 protein [Solirubrobacterales bacterium]
MARRVLILLQNEPLPHDRHVLNESRALLGAGYEVTVICPRGEGRECAPYERFEGIEIHRYEPRPGGERAAGYVVEYLAALREMRRLARRLARERPFDIVHACSPPDFLLLAALSLRRRGARFVFDHHDLTPELFRGRYGGGPLAWATLAGEQVAFRTADVVLSVNDSYRRIAIERGRRDPADVFVVRTGPDLNSFVPTAPDESLKRGKPFLLAYVGVMGPQDGVDEALRSLAELAARRCDWRAIFMGDGDVLGEMRALSARLGLDDCVEFTGWVEQDTICRVLSTADVGIAPDPKSPLNDLSSMVKISEYMAMSTPFVSFDLSESRVGAGEAALFAPSGDHAGFASLIAELLDDPLRRLEMGAAGRRRVLDSLAWEHQERALLAAYSRALS